MIERKIVLAFITSTEFHQKLRGLWDVTLFESSTAKRMVSWCSEYFELYEKAPSKDIEPLFYQKVKNGLPKDLAEEIEQDILPSLSEEYEREDFNVDYIVDQAINYFNERKLLQHAENIKALVNQNKLKEAEKSVLSYKPLETSASKAVSNFILNVKQIRAKKIPKAPLLMSPWLRKGQTTIIYASAGVGKSLIALLVSYLIGLKDYDDEEQEIGTWQVKNPTGTLYLDGEIGEQEMEERIGQFEWLGPQCNKYKIKILSVPEYQLATEDTFTLATRENQLKIIAWLKENPTYECVVLDSVSTLFGLVEENDASEWSNKVNPFLRDLRALKVACLMLHHSGKDGKRGMRGTSAMTAMAHNIFKLSDHPNKDPDLGEAHFIISKDKQRGAGFGFKSFGIHFFQNESKTETHWEITKYD